MNQVDIYTYIHSFFFSFFKDYFPLKDIIGFLGGSVVKNPPAMQKAWVRSLGWEDPLEKEMAAHSSILVWEIPWTEEPGALQSMGSKELAMTEWLSTHACNLLRYYQSLTDLGKENIQLQPTLAILSHLKRGRKKLRNTSEVHSPEAQGHKKIEI